MDINWQNSIDKTWGGFATEGSRGYEWRSGTIVTRNTIDKVGRIYGFSLSGRKLPCVEWEDGTKSIACNWDYISLATPEQIAARTKPAKNQYKVTVSYTHTEYPQLTKEVEYTIEAVCSEAVEYTIYNSSAYQLDGYRLHQIESVQ